MVRYMNENANIIDLLDEVGMLNLGLAELISAEVLIDIDSCLKTKERLERFKRDLPSSRKKDDEQVKKILKDAESIIEHDLQEYLTQKMLNNK